MKQAKRLQSLMCGALLLLAGVPAWAVPDSPGGPAVRQLNFQEPATQIAVDLVQLHNLLLVICLVIFIAVFGVMFYSIIKHRKSVGHKPATFHESTAVEIAWTIVPFLIVILMALPATKTMVAMKDTSSADVTIKATGMQWKWGYDYLQGEGQGISFLSNLSTPREQMIGVSDIGTNYLMEVDNPVVVPVNKKIRIVTTANDVIHAWGVNRLGAKVDAIPGFVRDTWFRAEKVGTYRGHCYELCGKDHAYMPIVVEVVSDEDYTKWVNAKKKEMAAQADDPTKTWTQDELMQRGEKIYAANCVACHQANGQGIPGTFPALAGSPVATGPKEPLLNIILHGKNGMPPWKGVLSETEIAAVSTYVRNAWGNKAPENTIIQPAEVVAAR
jgi:cytochrome c oxidase subunit 2